MGYKHSLFVMEKLESNTNIDCPNIEVIVIDEGLKYNSIAVLNELKQQYYCLLNRHLQQSLQYWDK